MNSTANQYITNNNHFDKVYINYAPGDNGGAIGAALSVSSNFTKVFENSSNPYLGTKYSNDNIFTYLKSDTYKNQISYDVLKNEDLFTLTAKILSDGNIIGWYQDEMEFGPRALGNRSILADPRNPNMKNIINKKIKRRGHLGPLHL